MFKSGNVTVMVKDFSRARQFYVETLGLKLQFEKDGHLAMVEAPGLMISLLHVGGEQDAQQGSCGSISIGFEVEDLKAAVEVLQARGVEFFNPVEGDAAQLIHFSDPEGNLLYLVCQ